MDPALSGVSFSPQLPDGGVSQPPHIPFTVLSETRQPISEPSAHLLRIIMGEPGVGFDERP